VAVRAQKEQAPAGGGFSERVRAAAYQTLHRALVAGLPTQIGHRTEKGDFQAPRQRRFLPFPVRRCPSGRRRGCWWPTCWIRRRCGA
jgi:ATP-dependent helicase HrpA